MQISKVDVAVILRHCNQKVIGSWNREAIYTFNVRPLLAATGKTLNHWKEKRNIDLLLSDVGSVLLISGPELKYFNQMSQTDLRSAAICANEEKDLTVTKTITVHIHA